MKAKILSIIMAAIAFVSLFSLASCKDETQYEKLDKEGYTISVKFDANGGDIKGATSNLIDAFNPNDYEADANGNIAIKLLSPDDEKRDKNNRLVFSKPGESFIGWYTERTFNNGVDDKDGCTYSGLWNFETDSLTVPKNGEYTSEVYQLTLYAAWLPKTTFNIYANDGSGSPTLLETITSFDIDLPKWEDGEPKITMGDFADRKGYTFDKAYFDEELTQQVTAETFRGEIDMTTGTPKSPVINIYTTWLEGNHFKIYKPRDMRVVSNDGICHIMSDLDFSEATWTLNSSKFSGTIYGNGHKISNIKLETTQGKASNGLFSEITATAIFKDVSFENIIHVIDVGRVNADMAFGLIAGKCADDAKFDNVTVSGKILFGTGCNNLKNYANINYDIGIFASNTIPDGINTSAIEVGLIDSDNSDFEPITDSDGYITLRFN